jgi:hypothetical protein
LIEDVLPFAPLREAERTESLNNQDSPMKENSDGQREMAERAVTVN